MKLTIVYVDGSSITIDCVESLRLRGHRVIETNTFGNGFVTHRNVKSYVTWFDFDASTVEVESYQIPSSSSPSPS